MARVCRFGGANNVSVPPTDLDRVEALGDRVRALAHKPFRIYTGACLNTLPERMPEHLPEHIAWTHAITNYVAMTNIGCRN